MVSLAPVVGQGELVAFNVGPDGLAYFVVALEPVDDRIEGPGGVSFAKTIPEHRQRYRVVAIAGSQPVLDVVIDGERFNIHDVQPLPDAFLLVCCRSRYFRHDDFEKNGRIYSREGEFLREILLGGATHTVLESMTLPVLMAH